MRLKLWSDGALTTGFNIYLVMPGRTADTAVKRLAAGREVFSKVELYEFTELRQLITSVGLTPTRALGT
jgi:hypothetical protein